MRVLPTDMAMLVADLIDGSARLAADVEGDIDELLRAAERVVATTEP